MKFLFSQISLAEIRIKSIPSQEFSKNKSIFFCVAYCCFEAFQLVRKCKHDSSGMSVVSLGGLDEGKLSLFEL